MSDATFKRGLRPVVGGVAGTTPKCNEYTLVTSKSVLEGEVVQMTANGTVTKVALATGSALNLLGPAAHKQTGSATATVKLLVYDDPNQIFVVDSALTNTSNTLAQVGACAGITNNSAANTTTDNSKGQLISVTTATANKYLKITAVAHQIGNVLANTGLDYLVQILPKCHVFAASTGV